MAPGARIIPYPAQAELRTGMPVAELRRWAESHHLGWALQTPVERLGGHARWASGLTVERAVCATTADPHWWMCKPHQKPAVDYLTARLQEARAIQAWVDDELPQWSKAPAEPAFRELWEHVLHRFEELRHLVSPTVLCEPNYYVIEDPPALRVFLLGRPHELAAEVPRLRLPEAAHLQLACLQALLELVHDPPPTLAQQVRRPSWQRDLSFLDRLVQVPDLPEDENKRLLGWEVLDHHGRWQVRPIQCRWTRTGKLQTRRIEVDDIPRALLTEPADIEVAGILQGWDRPPEEIVLQALAALAGHPRVVRKEGGARTPLDVRRGQLQLHVARVGDQLKTTFVAGRLALDHRTLFHAFDNDTTGHLAIVDQTDGLTLLTCTPEQRAFTVQWVARDVRLPATSLAALLARLPALQRTIPVHLDAELRGDVVEGDPRPLFRASFHNGSLVVEARVQPVPDAPSQVPGEGPDTVHVLRGGAPACVVRDRRTEPAQVRSLAEAAGLTEEVEQRPFVWAIDDLTRSLDVVRHLDPEHHRLEIDGSLPTVAQADTSGLSLQVGQGHDWFAVSGTLQTALGSVQLDQLMAAVDDGRSYVAVGKNTFVRLEGALQQQLGALAGSQAGPELSLQAVHTPLLQALEDAGATIQGTAAWRDLVDRIRAAATLQPELPEGLHATLRPYQEDGFRWLASLAEWAPGAVLADDMGLGKTLQAIALLLRRASEGPALVVAPTSVVFNWRTELARFAPSLQVVSYAGPQRADLLQQLAPGTVALCSYGVLQRDAEALAGVPFGTTVLDEAQAVKNPISRRARAAVRLDSAFRLSLSGTPVENRAEELWSLLAATVPGLLGTLPRFRERYGQADAHARRALARLVSPFVLRRTKRKVAQDLPERTELREVVTLTPEHQALYLRGRAQALARIADAPANKRRFLILSQLTRLRQLACDPRLVDPSCPVPGSKVEQLMHRLRALNENGDRALVFSSFVGHLELLRAACETAGLRVAWLTGSVAAAQRESEVARFQAGEADVFLISLKAGGTGLNLTAASYVFHLDPWWNPAAEDQATDRAHRIGQTQPVTVYRMVAEGTIEEQILSMHDDKRDLVDALMAGSDSALPVDADELMALLGDPMSKPAIAPTEPASTSHTPLGDFVRQAVDTLAQCSLKPRTRSAYGRALEQFVAWAQGQGVTTAEALGRSLPEYEAAASRGEFSPSRVPVLKAAWRRIS